MMLLRSIVIAVCVELMCCDSRLCVYFCMHACYLTDLFVSGQCGLYRERQQLPRIKHRGTVDSSGPLITASHPSSSVCFFFFVVLLVVIQVAVFVVH